MALTVVGFTPTSGFPGVQYSGQIGGTGFTEGSPVSLIELRRASDIYQIDSFVVQSDTAINIVFTCPNVVPQMLNVRVTLADTTFATRTNVFAVLGSSANFKPTLLFIDEEEFFKFYHGDKS